VHELAIAESMVVIANRHARGRRIASVEVKVGHLRQVVPSALHFAFELVATGTPAEGAELRIEEVPATGVCRTCGAERVLEGFPLTCARCGGLDVEVTGGEELLVDSLELEEEPETGVLQANSMNGGSHGSS
jgi:hydrogenase nickel incorporation protein HypA/HybF